MARSSILGSHQAPTHASGRDANLLGPSDSSDSGADIQGQLHLETLDDVDSRAAAISGPGNTDPQADSDEGGTGERAAAVPEHVDDGADVAPDRVVLPALEALDSSPDLVSLDDPQAVDIDNLMADDDPPDDEELRAGDDADLASEAARVLQAGP